MRGGARARSGPPPDPNALRRDRKDDKDTWTTLPAEGRKGSPPDWPLSGRAAHIPALMPTGFHQIKDEDRKQRILDRVEAEASALFAREVEIWEQEWKRPQAVEWERNGQQLEVAMYVRTLIGAESPDSPTNLRQLLKQQQEALGLSLPGLLRNRWKIAESADEAPASAPKVKSARGRFQVVDGGKS